MEKNFKRIRILKKKLLASKNEDTIDALSAAIDALMLLDTEYETYITTIPFVTWSVKYDGTYEIGDYKCEGCCKTFKKLSSYCPNCGLKISHVKLELIRKDEEDG